MMNIPIITDSGMEDLQAEVLTNATVSSPSSMDGLQQKTLQTDDSTPLGTFETVMEQAYVVDDSGSTYYFVSISHYGLYSHLTVFLINNIHIFLF